MGLYNSYKTNKAGEQEGVWVPFADNANIRLARAGGSNKRFLKAAEKFRRKHKHQLKSDILTDEMVFPEAVKIYAECIVLDWENVTNEYDEPLECTKENVIKVLTDLPDLFVDIQEAALNYAVYRDAIDEEAAKN